MSRETSVTLNTQTLIGFTELRGHAWHYRAEDQGSESNHYPGAVPVADVERRLFHWDAVEGDITATALTPDGVITTRDDNRKAIMRSDTGAILGVFGRESYKIHQYREWLLDTIALLIDDNMSIGSAGVLRGGGQAWVQIEVPETIKTPEGVEFRPHLLGATSLDGSLSTTFGRTVTNTVCDNTMSAALLEMIHRIKIRHSRYSSLKLTDAREALAIVHDTGETFAAQVAELCAITVTDKQWSAFLDSLAPIPTDEGRAKTMATNKREAIDNLYRHDMRVAPWSGSAYGVVQAVNTYTHHSQTVRNVSRGERNMSRAIMGNVDALDMSTLATLTAVLA